MHIGRTRRTRSPTHGTGPDGACTLHALGAEQLASRGIECTPGLGPHGASRARCYSLPRESRVPSPAVVAPLPLNNPSQRPREPQNAVRQDLKLSDGGQAALYDTLVLELRAAHPRHLPLLTEHLKKMDGREVGVGERGPGHVSRIEEVSTMSTSR